MQLSVHFELTLKNGTGKRRREFPLKVDFDTQEARTVIFGPSGCGKSLTLQAIAGLIKPDKGMIRLNDQILFDSEQHLFVPARQRRIGYVFQDYALFPHLTVLENAGYALQAWPRPLSPCDKDQIFALLESFNLTAVAHSLPHELSGGQRQRVALIRALLPQPAILLLDEPFSAMDMLLRVTLREELAAIQQRFELPMVMITHDLADVRAFADTLVLYREGTVKKVLSCLGAVDEIAGESAWHQVFEACQQVFEAT